MIWKIAGLMLVALAIVGAFSLGIKITRSVEAGLNRRNVAVAGWVAETVRKAKGEE
jgi:hypothetical protein